MVAALYDIGARERIRDRIAEIERRIDEKSYRPGPWDQLLKDVRMLPREDRAALKEEISRVSSKLHRRDGKRTLSLTTGIAAEAVLTLIGGVLIVFAIHNHSNGLANVLAIIAAGIWTMTFQPLVKVAVGYLLGVGYEYAYFNGAEPRFKMRFGDYLAARRWARIVLHLSGTIGSPLGAWLTLVCLPTDLRIAIDVCWAIFWIVVAVNIAGFIVALAGVRKLGPMKASAGSGGSAALELREALEF
jgi:hypothetical protein